MAGRIVKSRRPLPELHVFVCQRCRRYQSWSGQDGPAPELCDRCEADEELSGVIEGTVHGR